jgi:dolichol-phosphate mannosyltransferase
MPGPPWVILPTYEEAENVAAVVAGVRAALPDARVLIVDDASPDGTGAIADGLAAADPAVAVLHRPGRAGLGAAYGAGFGRALAEGAGHVVEMDADRSHDPADLPRLLAAARAGADLVIGSRYVPGGAVEDWGPLRRALSRAGCAYARRVLGVEVRDLTGGFKCFRAATLRRIDASSARAHGYAFQVELTWRALQEGFDVVEVPITFRDREQGRSKMSARIALEAAWRVPALRLARGRWRPRAEARPDADPLGHES